MRVEVSRKEFSKLIEVPSDVDMAGVMIRHDGWSQGSVLQFESEGISRQDEEIYNDGTTQIIVLYYRSAELAEVMKAFIGFEGMTYVEVQEGDCHIRIIV